MSISGHAGYAGAVAATGLSMVARSGHGTREDKWTGSCPGRVRARVDRATPLSGQKVDKRTRQRREGAVSVTGQRSALRLRFC